MSSFRPVSPFIAALATALAAAVPASAQTTHIIEEGQAQVVAAFADSTEWIRHHLWVETEFDTDGDGRPDRLHVDVARPAQTETEGLRVPVIYETSPYYSGVSGLNFDHFWDLGQEVGGEPHPRDPFPPTIPHIADQPVISNSHVGTWVPRGFAVVHSQSPGTGQSDGCPTMGGANESLAPKAVVDWLNGRARGFSTPDGNEEVTAEWATGKVGMTGTSFNGTLPLAAATTGVAGLEAIVPIAPNTSYYHYYRSNGLVRSPSGYPGEDIDVLFDFVFSGDPEDRDYCIANVRDELEARLDRVSGDYSDFWAARDYLNHIDGVRAATLMAHGFNDWNVMPEHSYRVTEALKERGVPLQIYYHQDGHGGPPPLAMMNRWFTRYLLGVENGVEDDPRAWIVRAGDEMDDPTAYPDYPHPDAEEVALHPSAPGNAVGALSLHAAESAAVETFVDDYSLPGADLAAIETSEHRLLYATPPLERDVHISGAPRVRIRVAADATAANLTVWLVALPWTPEPDHIGENVITKGWADPRNSEDPSIETPRTGSPLVPGEFVEFEFALQPDDQVIPAGARIGLMILSSDQKFTVHPTPGTELSVDLSGTWLTLPVVGGVAAIRPAG